MKNTLRVIGILVAGWLLQRCAADVPPPSPLPASAAVEIALPGGDTSLYIDSAQVFFFRELDGRDTLILRQVIHGIGTQPRKFNFSLPAGYYTMAIFGNIATSRTVLRPPYSRDSIWFSYQGGIEPPDVYYGLNYLNVGVDTLRGSGNILLVSRVELTLENVPAGIERIEMQVLETSSGLGLNGYLKEVMVPPLGASVSGVQAGSTYTLRVNCFPPAVNNGESSVQVRCYDAIGKQVYSGTSQPFPVKSGVRMILSGTFGTTPPGRMRRVTPETEDGNGIFTLEWNYNEKNN